MTAIQPAVQPAVNPDWLTVDTTSAERGYGPAVYGSDPSPAPVVPTSHNPLPADSPELVQAAEVYPAPQAGSGPVAPLPCDNGWTLPVQRPTGEPQGLSEALQPSQGSYSAAGSSALSEPYQTYDYVYQSVNPQGWQQNIPNDRTSHRKQWWQANPSNNPTWYPYGERPVVQHTATVASDVNPAFVQGAGPGMGNGSLPQWNMTGPQGNTAYVTPGPPPTTPASPVTQSSGDPASAWV